MQKPEISSSALAKWFLLIVFMMVILADFIANDRPIFFITEEDDWGFFNRKIESDHYSFVINPPVGFKGGLDLSNSLLPPFTDMKSGHILGTDHLGRDLLAGVIHGSRMSLGISIIAIFIASLVGIIVGGLAGYLGDRKLDLTFGFLISFSVVAVGVLYFLFHLNFLIIPFIILCLFALLLERKVFPNVKALQRTVKIPVDFLSLKLMEIFSSIPGYFLVMGVVVFIESNWFVFAVIIGLTRWVHIARLIRGEMISIRSKGYIESALALGLSQWQVFLRHALPNALGPLPYAVSFGIASIIMIESTLSYFGIGLPADSISWGNFISGFKNQPSSWWIALIPGLVMFLTILSLHVMGRSIDKRYNPKRHVSPTY